MKALPLIIILMRRIDVYSPQHWPRVDLIRLGLLVVVCRRSLKRLLSLKSLWDRILKDNFLLQINVQFVFKVFEFGHILVSREVKQVVSPLLLFIFGDRFLQMLRYLIVALFRININ